MVGCLEWRRVRVGSVGEGKRGGTDSGTGLKEVRGCGKKGAGNRRKDTGEKVVTGTDSEEGSGDRGEYVRKGAAEKGKGEKKGERERRERRWKIKRRGREKREEKERRYK